MLPLRAAAANEGIELLALGLDPFNPAEAAPLLLHTPRYARMADYLAAIGPAGARMMRQTAAFQVSLDLDDEPWPSLDRAERRRALRRGDLRELAGVRGRDHGVPEHEGAGVAGARSRAHRTGLGRGDPIGHYCDFALRCARRSFCRSSTENTAHSASGWGTRGRRGRSGAST